MTTVENGATVGETPLKSVEVPSPTAARVEPKAEAKPEPEDEVNAGAESDDPDEGAEGDDHEDDGRVELPRGVKRKLAKQSKKIAQLAIEAETLRAQLQQKAQQPQEAERPARPRPEDFEFDLDRYEKALRDYHENEFKRETQVRQVAESHQKRVNEYLAKDPEGWHEAITAPIQYTQAMLESIAESDVGPQVAVYLARNLEEGVRISQLSDSAAIRAIGRIEAMIESQKTAAPPKKTTAAPPPPKTVTGASGVSRDINDPSLTTAERIKLWKAKGAAKP